MCNCECLSLGDLEILVSMCRWGGWGGGAFQTVIAGIRCPKKQRPCTAACAAMLHGPDVTLHSLHGAS